MFVLRSITKATNTHFEYVELIFFSTATTITRMHLEVMFIRTLRDLLLYTHIIRN